MSKQKHSDLDRLLAATSYVWVLWVIPYTLGHHKPYVFRHAQQGMALFIFEILLMAISLVPLLGWFVSLPGWIFVCVTSVLGIGHALAGQDWEVPFLHRYTHDPLHGRGKRRS